TPLPAPRARILPGHDRLCAMGAADARVVLVMQRVVRHFIDLDVRPYIGPRPTDKRIDLHELEGVVPLDRLGIRPGRRLLPPNARNPGIVAVEDAPERLDFPQLAASVRAAGP